MKTLNRKLLQLPNYASLPNQSNLATSSSSPPTLPPIHHSLYSSMAFTLAVFIVGLLCMGLYSFYLRRVSGDFSSSDHRGARNSSQLSDLPSRTNNQSVGVDPETVQALPVYSYRGDEKYQIDCAICLSEFEENEAVKMIPFCKHVFHPECIDAWLSGHVTCPVCRSSRFFEGEEGLGVKEEKCDQGVSGSDERRSTVGNHHDECVEVMVVVGSFNVRRNSSCSNLTDRAMLQRTLSF